MIKKENNQSRIMRNAILTLTVATLMLLSVPVAFADMDSWQGFPQSVASRPVDRRPAPRPVDRRPAPQPVAPQPVAPPGTPQPVAPQPKSLPLVNPIEADNFQEFLDAIIGFLFWLGLALAPVFFLISAFYFMTAAGNPTQIETGKRIITYTVIGLLVIIMARGAVELLQRLF